MAKKETNHSQIIDQLTANTKELLSANYSTANSYRDANEVVKITLYHLVYKNEFGELIAESVIAFGKRLKERVEHTVDMTAQFDFDKPIEPPLAT